MFALTLRNLRAKKGRVVSMSIAIVVAVAFLSGSLVLVDTIGASFDDLFETIGEDVDAVVRSTNVVETDFGDIRASIDESLVDEVRALPEVESAGGDVGGYAQLVDKDGDAMGNPGNGPPTLGFGWSDVGNPMVLVEGTEPTSPNDVVIDKQSADNAGFEIGDPITVLLESGPGQFVVSGIARFGDADSAVGASLALFEFSTAQALIGEPDRVDTISVTAAEGISQDELRIKINGILPTDVEVISGNEATEEAKDDIAGALGFFNTFMLIFAVIAVFVSSFIIYNTFSILVAQRTRELALLRALGARRRQIVGSVLLEALVIGIVASAVGLVGGLAVADGLQRLLDAVGVSIPTSGVVFAASTVWTAFIVGIGVTMLAALIPSRRASATAPLAAIREATASTASTGKARIAFGVVVGALALPALLAGLFADVGARLELIGVGAAGVFVSVAALSPMLARPFARVVGYPIAAIRGVPGELAVENAIRNPKRTATTASALMIGVGLVGAIAIFASSAKASVNDIIDRSLIGDFVVDSGSAGFGGLSPELSDRLNELPEVEAASGVRFGFVEVDESTQSIYAIDTSTIESLVDVGVVEGRIGEMGPGDIGVFQDWADDRGLGVGSRLPVRFPESGSQLLTVSVIFTEDELTENFFISHEAYDANFRDSFDFQVYVGRAEGADPDQTRAAIEAVASDYANAEVQNLEEYKDGIAAQIDQLLGLVYALLALAVLIALLGIANTLALSTLERTRELGLLRAVGMTRRQLRSAVRWESVLIALFGALLGAIIGVFFGWVIVKALEDEGFSAFEVPYVQFAVIGVLAVIAGVIASGRPAWRAAKLNILEAIATE